MSVKTSQGTPQHTSGTGEMQTRIRQYVDRGTGRMSEMVRHQPTRSLFTCAAIGFGIGFVVGRVLGQPAPSTSYFDRSSAERLGSRLLERVEQIMPDAVRDRLFHR